MTPEAREVIGAIALGFMLGNLWRKWLFSDCDFVPREKTLFPNKATQPTETSLFSHVVSSQGQKAGSAGRITVTEDARDKEPQFDGESVRLGIAIGIFFTAIACLIAVLL